MCADDWTKILGCGAENAGAQKRLQNKESPAIQRGTRVTKLIKVKKIGDYSWCKLAVICAALPDISVCWKEAWEASLANMSFRIMPWKDEEESRFANASFLAILMKASFLAS